MTRQTTTKVGIAGLGAIGTHVARALLEGIDGYELVAICDLKARPDIIVDYVDFATLCDEADLIIEALPPEVVPELLSHALPAQNDVILISGSALLLHPEILTQHKHSSGRIIVPSGALSGLDGVSSLAQKGIKSATIKTTKKPLGFGGAPYIIQSKIDLGTVTEKQPLFRGNAMEAAAAFPANVNVAATLSLAGLGPEETTVEIWADPNIEGNTHEIEVIGEYSTITGKVSNTPDPSNPKSSILAALSIISTLKKLKEPLSVI